MGFNSLTLGNSIDKELDAKPSVNTANATASMAPATARFHNSSPINTKLISNNQHYGLLHN